VYNNWFINFFKLSYVTTNKYIDKGLLELFGPFGIYKLSRQLSKSSVKNSPNIIFFMIGWMFFFIVFILTIILLVNLCWFKTQSELIVVVLILLSLLLYY